jgi:Protein of unknown function (DUF3631)
MSEDIGGFLLDEIAKFLERFVVMSRAQADTMALFVAHTHAADAAEATPYLCVTSAEKRSGKSRLREALELVVHQPLPASNISDAALFRAVATLGPTLLLDEADAIFKSREREDLRGMLNAGYRRGALAYRMGGANKTTLENFPVFCPKAFFGIGDFLPDTLADRAITIRLQRRTRTETVERFRLHEVKPEGEMLRDRVADWLEPQVDHLRTLKPELPDELDDRAQDSWECLFAIADLAGEKWPMRARAAALEVSTGDSRLDDSLTARLLADLHGIFATTERRRFQTAELIDELVKIEESPWGDWHGRPITPQALSKLLRPYRIQTMSVKVDGVTVRGYKAEQFAEAFDRTLGVGAVTGVTAVTSRLAPGAASNAGNAGNATYANGHIEVADDELERLIEEHHDIVEGLL